MTRSRKHQIKAEEDSLPIRSTSRKRKLVEYTERDSNDDESPTHSDEEIESDDTLATRKAPIQSQKTPKKINTSTRTRYTSKEKSSSAPSPLTAKGTTVTETDPNGIEQEEEFYIRGKATKSSPSKKKTKSKPPVTDTQALDPELSHISSPPSDTKSPKAKRKRKTKEEKEAEMLPLAARSPSLKYFVGAHTSVAKGVENAILNANHIGANAFACFLKSQRKWDNPSLKPESVETWKTTLQTHTYNTSSHVVPHGSYLVNLASADAEMTAKSYNAFLDDLKRCETLGIKYYNFHPGSAGTQPLDVAISRLAENLNRALSATSTVVPLLENMASRGSILGGRFSDLSSIIALISPEHRLKNRIGVCIDTCHAFASGYDLRSPEAFQATLTEFDSVVGLRYLKALHLNDSKAPLGSHRDLHQNIGLGFLGLRAFHNVMNDPRLQDLPLILETPCEKPDPSDKSGKRTLEDKSVWAREIKLLESLTGMDPAGEEFRRLERELSETGKEERIKMQKTFDEKIAKEKRKSEKGQRSLKDMFGAAGGGRGEEKGNEEGKRGRTGKGKDMAKKSGKKAQGQEDQGSAASESGSESE